MKNAAEESNIPELQGELQAACFENSTRSALLIQCRMI